VDNENIDEYVEDSLDATIYANTSVQAQYTSNDELLLTDTRSTSVEPLSDDGILDYSVSNALLFTESSGSNNSLGQYGLEQMD
jgi:hypothetical protein